MYYVIIKRIIDYNSVIVVM